MSINSKEISIGDRVVIIEGDMSGTEETKIKEYLQKKKEAELQSSYKLEQLRNEIENQDSLSGIMNGSELEKKLGGREKLKFYLDILETGTKMYLFEGDNAPFKGLNISDNAKNTFCNGATFFLVESLGGKLIEQALGGNIENLFSGLLGDNKTSGLLEDVLKGNGITDLVTSHWSTLMNGTDFSKIGEVFKSIFDAEKIGVISEALTKANIESYGDNNGVFTNPAETYEFLKFSFKANNEQDIINYINGKNGKDLVLNPEQKKHLQLIGDLLPISEEMGQVLSKGASIEKLFDGAKNKIKELITGNGSIIGVLGMLIELPWLGDILKKFLKMVGIENFEDLLAGREFSVSKKVIEETIIKKGNIFESKKVGENFMKTTNGKNDIQFLKNLKVLIGKKEGDEFKEGIENLFSENGEFKNFSDKLGGSLINDDIIDYKTLANHISLITKYKEQLKENPNLTVDEFISSQKPTESLQNGTISNGKPKPNNDEEGSPVNVEIKDFGNYTLEVDRQNQAIIFEGKNGLAKFTINGDKIRFNGVKYTLKNAFLSLSWGEQNSNATLNLETLDLVVNGDKLNLKEFYEKNEGISGNPEKIEFSSGYKLIKDS